MGAEDSKDSMTDNHMQLLQEMCREGTLSNLG